MADLFHFSILSIIWSGKDSKYAKSEITSEMGTSYVVEGYNSCGK